MIEFLEFAGYFLYTFIMEKFPLKKESADAITPENFETLKKQLSEQVWAGKYDKALPLADEMLKYRTENGDRDAALVNYASNYYSAASRLWKEKGTKEIVSVGKYMNTALRALQERLEKEIEIGGGKKAGMIPVSLDRMIASELDVMQAVYRKAAVIADKVPLVKPMRQLLLSKENDKVRDWDAAALLSIRAGLNKVREARESEKPEAPHTEIFLRIGAFEIAKRYGWNKDAKTRANKVFELAKEYPWPSKKNVNGQDVRVARQLRDVALAIDDKERAIEYEKRAKLYAEKVPDKKAKL